MAENNEMSFFVANDKDGNPQVFEIVDKYAREQLETAITEIAELVGGDA
jgi:hypothetical protein